MAAKQMAKLARCQLSKILAKVSVFKSILITHLKFHNYFLLFLNLQILCSIVCQCFIFYNVFIAESSVLVAHQYLAWSEHDLNMIFFFLMLTFILEYCHWIECNFNYEGMSKVTVWNHIYRIHFDYLKSKGRLIVVSQQIVLIKFESKFLSNIEQLILYVKWYMSNIITL